MIVLVGAEVTATLGEKEYWSNEQEMLNSLPISEQMIKGNQSDSVDPESE